MLFLKRDRLVFYFFPQGFRPHLNLPKAGKYKTATPDAKVERESS
jgi:hypothetical protein